MWGGVRVNIYFDTEFTGLHKNTTLISIGLISEDGKQFYAELVDYDKSQCDKWITDNVLKHLTLQTEHFVLRNIDWKSEVQGTKSIVKKHLEKWLAQFDDVQLVSDVCHYDMVLLIDLFDTAFDLPKNVNAACHDINQDIARHYGISEKEAFNKSREEILIEKGISIDGDKHNALYDAKVIKEVYKIVGDINA